MSGIVPDTDNRKKSDNLCIEELPSERREILLGREDGYFQRLAHRIQHGKPEFAAVDGNGTIFNNIEDKSEIVRLDAHARKMTAEWPAGCESPSGLAFDVAGHRLFPVCDGKKMAVVDSNTGKILATPAIGDGPDAANYSPAKKLAFASSGDGVLSVVDTAKADYPTIQSLATQRGARTMTYDPSTDRIYTVTAEFGPRPAATTENPRPRPAIVPGSFTVIVIGR